MVVSGNEKLDEFKDEIRHHFYRRTLLCLWLGVIFFSLFSLLDFFYCREFFPLFIIYRAVVVLSLLACLGFLQLDSLKRSAPQMMAAMLLLGTFAISLMALKLGGFGSGYYVGILLIIVGAFSVLPVKGAHALILGLLMYLLYLGTMVIGESATSFEFAVHGAGNSFFFIVLVCTTAIQSSDELQLKLNSLRAQKNIIRIQEDLLDYTDNLEQLIERRMAEKQVSTLKFQDLYENLLDLALLVDKTGIIQMTNRQCEEMLGVSANNLTGCDVETFIRSRETENPVFLTIKKVIDQESNGIEGMQLQICKDGQWETDVELSASYVNLETERFYQLIFRDISTTKKMQRRILESERLIDSSRQAAIFGLAKLAECRDDETGGHLDRIRLYTQILTEELKNQPEMKGIITRGFIEDIYRTSVLHDIGKVGIPDDILLKPGKLTESEYSMMKNHCVFGATTLQKAEPVSVNSSFLKMGCEIAHFHHERWDGSGYPEGLSGEAIPLAARIVALADVYDALTTERIYKPAFDHDYTRKIIVDERGGQFDPFVVDAFVNKEEEFKNSHTVFKALERG